MISASTKSACRRPPEPQLIRITNHGKITTWVAFALDFLDVSSFAFDANRKHAFVPIVLHTLPATANPPDPTPTPAPGDGTGRANSNPNPNPKPNANPPSLAHTASTVPRLISVVEIIKREYLKKLELEHSSTLLGLHQYNEIGTLEEELRAPEPPSCYSACRRGAVSGDRRSAAGDDTTKQTPFMRITLSRVELPGLAAATYQPPVARKVSKSAKARAKRREKKKGAELEGTVDMIE
ncbi:hypothetical protein B0H14DRAFT_3490773 [Mycena olivaceomarginata]|nr:hypothetical protein B0H14DRAFT_3490773 [Mycena olivaceomarginata]